MTMDPTLISTDEYAAQQANPYKRPPNTEEVPVYGALGTEGIKKVYDEWRASTGKPNFPEWHEMGDYEKAQWMQSNSRRVNEAKRAATEKSFVPELNRPVVVSESTEDKTLAVRVGRHRQKARSKSGVFPSKEHEAVFRATQTLPEEQRTGEGTWSSIPEMNVNRAEHPNAPSAVSSDFSHHDNANALIDSIVRKHTTAGGDGSLTTNPLTHDHPLAVAARTAKEQLSISAKAQSIAKNDPKMKEAALAHFTTAMGHVMTAARIAHGEAANRGESVGPMAPEMMEANTHLTNYRNMLSKVK